MLSAWQEILYGCGTRNMNNRKKGAVETCCAVVFGICLQSRSTINFFFFFERMSDVCLNQHERQFLANTQHFFNERPKCLFAHHWSYSPWQSQNYCSYIQDCSLGRLPRPQSIPQQVGSLQAEILIFLQPKSLSFCNEEALFPAKSTSSTQNRCPKDKCATVTTPTRNVHHQRRHMTTFVSQHLNLPFLPPRDSMTGHSATT